MEKYLDKEAQRAGDEEMKEEPEEEKKEETVEDIYNRFKYEDSYFTDYMQCVFDEKYRVQIPQHSGSFGLFQEGT